MSRIRGTNTLPEVTLRKTLYAIGVRGWRLHRRQLPGSPDLAFGRWKVAVFVDGAFWHGHASKFSPGRLSPAWEAKIRANQGRDRRVDRQLTAMGWCVVRLWDFEVARDALAQAERVRDVLNDRGYVGGLQQRGATTQPASGSRPVPRRTADPAQQAGSASRRPRGSPRSPR